jgi:hypothetical protein
MPTFVQLVVTGKIDSKKDTKRINEVLNKLQTSGAAINSVKLSATSGSSLLGTRGDYAVYVITYEANMPISI